MRWRKWELAVSNLTEPPIAAKIKVHLYLVRGMRRNVPESPALPGFAGCGDERSLLVRRF